MGLSRGINTEALCTLSRGVEKHFHPQAPLLPAALCTASLRPQAVLVHCHSTSLSGRHDCYV